MRHTHEAFIAELPGRVTWYVARIEGNEYRTIIANGTANTCLEAGNAVRDAVRAQYFVKVITFRPELRGGEANYADGSQEKHGSFDS